MVKHTYTVEAPDGTLATRTTHRIYTHVVFGRRDIVNDRLRAGYFKSKDPAHFNHLHSLITDREQTTHYQEWVAIRWCGRLDLATKELRAEQWGYTDLRLAEVK